MEINEAARKKNLKGLHARTCGLSQITPPVRISSSLINVYKHWGADTAQYLPGNPLKSNFIIINIQFNF